MSTPDVAEQLDWERTWRPRAAAAAVGAALLMTGAQIGAAVALADAPTVGILEAVRNGLAAGEAADPGLLAPYVLFIDEKAVALVAGAAGFGIGALLLVPALLVLFRAARFRRPETPALALPLLMVGAVAVATVSVAQQVARVLRAGDFADASDQTSDAADEALTGGLTEITSALGFPASVALGFAFLMISLNAMRAGLLTRFMGYLGVFVALLFVLPLGAPVIVQSFWLGALALLLTGRWPNGVPEAWDDGRAHPWPTMADLREQQAATRAASPPEEEADEEPGATQHPASKKRKRKRRR